MTAYKLVSKGLTVIAILLCSFVLNAELVEGESDNIVVLTKYQSSSYVGEKSYRREDGTLVVIPSTINFVFSVSEVIAGDENFKEQTLSFDLDLGSTYAMERASGIVLVVKKTGDGGYLLQDWSFVMQMYCIDKSLVLAEDSEYFFKPSSVFDDRERCRNM